MTVQPPPPSAVADATPAQAAAVPFARPKATALQTLGALAHLAVLGITGPVAVGAVATLAGAGIGLAPILGIGLVLLVGFVYVLFGLAWLETARVDGLYRLGLPPLTPRPRVGPGFGGWLRTLWRQAIDPSMWRALASGVVSMLLGVATISLLALFASAVALAFAPLYATGDTVRPNDWWFAVPVAWSVPLGIGLALLTAAASVGFAILHGLLTRTILSPNREAQYAAEAHTSARQRDGAIRASEVERTRIERDLHDGVQPRLVSVGMTLGLAQQKLDDDPDTARALIEEAHTSTKAAITELRQLARGIHASVLDDRGLDAALSALAGRSHIPVQLDVRLDGRCRRDAEAAVYFSIAEALTNAAKHSRASECRVVVRIRDGATLWARVEDNGLGGARVVPGGGIDGISQRALAAGGTVRLDSPLGGPTSLEVSVPCAS